MPAINQLPITLTPIPAPTGISALNFDQLLNNICSYISASVQANVSFFQIFSSPPASFQGNLIFVTGLENFMVWDVNTGQYNPLNQIPIGGVLQQSVIYGAPSFDDLQNGFVYLNGRVISSIAGLSATQQDNLNALYPNGGILPNVQPLAVFPVGQMAIVGTLTSGTGFVDGETVTQTTSGATAKVYKNQGLGITNLIVLDITGTPNGTDIWTGGTSMSVFTPDGTPIPYYGPYLVISRVFIGANIPPV